MFGSWVGSVQVLAKLFHTYVCFRAFRGSSQTTSLCPEVRTFTIICTEACFSLHSFLLLLLLSLIFFFSLGLCHLLSLPVLLSFSSSFLFAHPSATIEAIEAIETVKDAEGKIPLISLCVCECVCTCVHMCVCACAAWLRSRPPMLLRS